MLLATVKTSFWNQFISETQKIKSSSDGTQVTLIVLQHTELFTACKLRDTLILLCSTLIKANEGNDD